MRAVGTHLAVRNAHKPAGIHGAERNLKLSRDPWERKVVCVCKFNLYPIWAGRVAPSRGPNLEGEKSTWTGITQVQAHEAGRSGMATGPEASNIREGVCLTLLPGCRAFGMHPGTQKPLRYTRPSTTT